ncbi:hypothetical protein TRFO_33217 [Tritrichomonas foetus]|uniref:Uncharacterized protein n=1 Tax=Tritrichomonas foetus TaxID=1144522 RepID=A0A1J4JM39_9EUKA|nr:hypothetical protein TRFO_33217 [Tritrichomonas foetus]|eukprot:OHT00185.1 hypothetical protein TRFO_33217 [Tritrichomonas foetus]
MEKEINWENLESNTISALRFVCQQFQIIPNGKTKKDYIYALQAYKSRKEPKTTQPPTGILMEPADFQQPAPSRGYKRPNQFVENRKKMENPLNPEQFQKKRKVPPPTPPKGHHSRPKKVLPSNLQSTNPTLLNISSSENYSEYSDRLSPVLPKKRTHSKVKSQKSQPDSRKKKSIALSTILLILLIIVLILLIL